MLVLSRNSGERIRIGSDIVLTIMAVTNSRAKIAIDAPVTVKIYREELYQRVVSENRKAIQGALGADDLLAQLSQGRGGNEN